MNRRPDNSQRLEVAGLGRALRRGAAIVLVKCYAVTGPRGCRFEIVLWSDGVTGVVDVAGVDEAELERRVDAATDAFAAALTLRRGPGR